MCVILVADGTRPSPEMVDAAYEANSHGAGVAWRDVINGETVVRWKKGLELDEVQDLVATLPMPFISHYRISTVGGTVKALTHPFPIEPMASVDLEGHINGYVLFHNGHWARWDDRILDIAIHHPRAVLPTGKWSDSRGMAWAAANIGMGLLEMTGEKIAVLSPTELGFCKGTAHNGWCLIDGVIASNNFFSGRMSAKRRLVAANQSTENKVVIDDTKKVGGGATSPLVKGLIPTTLEEARMMRALGTLSKKAYKRHVKRLEREGWKASVQTVAP